MSLDLRARLLAATGLPVLARRRPPGGLRILMYHGVVEAPLEVPCWHQLPLDVFRRQMAWLARTHRVLPLEEALERLVEGTLPSGAAALTFDDGYRSVRELAGPVLARLGLPATVYLVTDLLGTDDVPWPDAAYLGFARATVASVDVPDLGLPRRSLRTPAERGAAYATAVRALKGLPTAEKDARLAALLAALAPTPGGGPGPFRMLSPEDVRCMAREGTFTFGGHTTRHELLARMPDGTVAAAIGRSHERVGELTGRPPATFAYPNGRAMDFDDRARAALGHLGVRFALSTIDGVAAPGSDRLALPRLAVGSDLSMPRFRLLASGALAWLRR